MEPSFISSVLPTRSLLLAGCISMLLFVGLPSQSAEGRPNILFIIVDDLNDMPLRPEGKPFVPTPNIDRIAASGVSFTNAHCNDPICAPSRSSMFTGLYPQTSGLYWFENYRQNAILKHCVTLTEHLDSNGYGVFGVGKVYHGAQDPKGFYVERGPAGNFGPWPWDGRKETRRGYIAHPQQLYLYAEGADPDMDFQWEHTFGPLTNIPTYLMDEENGVPGYEGWFLNGASWKYESDRERDPMPDETYAEWTSKILAQQHEEKPFALFTGFCRTHTPLYAPQEYFDRFPLDEIEVPKAFLEGDLEDCAPTLGDPNLYAFRRYQMLFNHPDRPELFKEWLQAYMACVSFVDDQVGVVLDALETSPHADNTIVFLTSDHGFHVGGKEAIYKQTLWDSGTKVPFLVSGLEGIAEGATCHQPVSLIDVYPTFIELCGLPENPHAGQSGYPLDGHSLVPLMLNPEGEWSGPAVAITALPGKDHSQHRDHLGTLYPHFSVRAEDWRYTLTSNGEEELYHYSSDPFEFTNLADEPEHSGIKADLRDQLIALRDGDKWQSYDQFPSETFSGVEFRAEVSGEVEVRFGEKVVATVDSADWVPLRVRVAGNRSQVWVDHRVVSDTLREIDFPSGRLTRSGGELRGLTIREL